MAELKAVSAVRLSVSPGSAAHLRSHLARSSEDSSAARDAPSGSAAVAFSMSAP